MTEPADFDLDKILDGAKHTQKTVRLYLNGDAAARAVDLNLALLEAKSAEDPEEEKARTKELKDLLADLEAESLEVTLRALATEEVNVIRRIVVKDNPIPTRDPEEMKRLKETERTELAMIHLLSNAIIGAKHGDAETSGFSIEEVSKLRRSLPSAEWDKLTKTYDDVQAGTAVFEGLMADPTFRWGFAD